MNVRGKVALELGIIAVLTTAFLLLFPKRNPAVDVALAGFALVCIALSAGYTRTVVWSASPPQVAEIRFKRCLVVTFWVTVPPALLFVLIGGFINLLPVSAPSAAGVLPRRVGFGVLLRSFRPRSRRRMAGALAVVAACKGACARPRKGSCASSTGFHFYCSSRREEAHFKIRASLQARGASRRHSAIFGPRVCDPQLSATSMLSAN